MMHRSGLRNVLEHLPRYPELDLETLKQANPQVILLSSEPYPFKEKHKAEVQAAMPDAKVILVDGEMFSWYGSRLLQSATYLANLLPTL
jgi:ABC-type Fe3+-hydroxamate transport system substrate-binding protein